MTKMSPDLVTTRNLLSNAWSEYIYVGIYVSLVDGVVILTPLLRHSDSILSSGDLCLMTIFGRISIDRLNLHNEWSIIGRTFLHLYIHPRHMSHLLIVRQQARDDLAYNKTHLWNQLKHENKVICCSTDVIKNRDVDNMAMFQSHSITKLCGCMYNVVLHIDYHNTCVTGKICNRSSPIAWNASRLANIYTSNASFNGAHRSDAPHFFFLANISWQCAYAWQQSLTHRANNHSKRRRMSVNSEDWYRDPMEHNNNISNFTCIRMIIMILSTWLNAAWSCDNVYIFNRLFTFSLLSMFNISFFFLLEFVEQEIIYDCYYLYRWEWWNVCERARARNRTAPETQ